MATPFEIQFKATGQQAAAAAATAVKKAIDDLGQEIAALPAEEKAAAEAARVLVDDLEDLAVKARKVAESSDQVATGTAKVGTSSIKGGQAVLELSRGFEDLQYGIGGVLNNIPSLVASLGGGAGLAGIISIVAVLAAKLGPILLKSSEESQAAAEAAAKAEQDLADNIETAANRAAEAKKAALIDVVAATKEANEAEIKQITELTSALDGAIAARQKLRRLKLEEQSAGAALELAKIDQQEKAGVLSPSEAISARSGIATGLAAAKANEEDNALREQLQAALAKQRAREQIAAAEQRQAEQAQAALADTERLVATYDAITAQLEAVAPALQAAQDAVGFLDEYTSESDRQAILAKRDALAANQKGLREAQATIGDVLGGADAPVLAERQKAAEEEARQASEAADAVATHARELENLKETTSAQIETLKRLAAIEQERQTVLEQTAQAQAYEADKPAREIDARAAAIGREGLGAAWQPGLDPKVAADLESASSDLMSQGGDVYQELQRLGTVIVAAQRNTGLLQVQQAKVLAETRARLEAQILELQSQIANARP